MKRTKQTALTAAVFAAALGISQAGSTASAAVDFSPESQQIAAVLYGPPPLVGDIDENRCIDARDLTLMKQYLLKLKQDSSYMPEKLYLYNMDDSLTGSADARILRNRITCMSEPVEYQLCVKWVPYLSSEIPERGEERQALEQRAQKLYGTEDYFYPNAYSETGEDIILSKSAYLTYPSADNYDIFHIRYSAVPDAEIPNRTTLRVHLYFRRLTEEEHEHSFNSFSRSTVGLPEREPDQNDIQFDLDLISRREQPDGTVQLYDKCIVEYDILTGACLVHDPLTPEQDIPEREFPG